MPDGSSCTNCSSQPKLSLNANSTLSPFGGRLGPGLAADAATSQGKTAEPSAMALGTVPRSEFVSNKLAPKLAQQLKVGHSG